MLTKIYQDNPNSKAIDEVVEVLRKGGIVIFPTDTVYGMGCDINNSKAVEKVCRIKGINIKKDHLSFICYDISQISDYVKPLNNSAFKTMKKNFPGPFTFILNANSNIPKLFKNNKKTVGIRIPENQIIRDIVYVLGNPVLSTSIYDEDEILEYTTDPELIHEKYADVVDMVIDGGYGGNQPSTIIDLTNHDFKIIRQGKGELIL